MGAQQSCTASLLALWGHHLKRSFFQVRMSGGFWLREEGSSGAEAEGHLLQWKAGICEGESVKAKREERLMSKPGSIYFSLHSVLGSSLTSRGREKVTPLFKERLKHCPRQSGFHTCPYEVNICLGVAAQDILVPHVPGREG